MGFTRLRTRRHLYETSSRGAYLPTTKVAAAICMKLSIIYNQCTEYRFSRGRGSLVAPMVLLLYNLVGQPVVCVVQSFNKSHFAFRDSRLYGFWLYLRTVCFVSGIIVPCPLLSYLPVRLFLLSPRRYFWSASLSFACWSVVLGFSSSLKKRIARTSVR